jgi:hypothetical protein
MIQLFVVWFHFVYWRTLKKVIQQGRRGETTGGVASGLR